MAGLTILDPGQLRGELKEGSIHSVYLFAGADGFRAERTARWLREKVVDPAMGGLNSESIWADERSPAQIAEAAAAYPMFGGRRFLWVRHAEMLSSGTAIESLLQYLSRPSESTVLVFTSSKLDKRLKFTAACAAKGRVVDFAPLSAGALRSQIGGDRGSPRAARRRSVGDRRGTGQAGPDLRRQRHRWGRCERAGGAQSRHRCLRTRGFPGSPTPAAGSLPMVRDASPGR